MRTSLLLVVVVGSVAIVPTECLLVHSVVRNPGAAHRMAREWACRGAHAAISDLPWRMVRAGAERPACAPADASIGRREGAKVLRGGAGVRVSSSAAWVK
jgi:hypothetical protein